MKNRILHNRWVIGLIVVALIVGCFQLKTYWWQPGTVRAQTDDDDDDLSGGALAVLLLSVGQGQKMRLSVGTIPGATEKPYSWFFTVHNTRNEVLFRSERIDVPSSEWRFSDVFREDLNIVGEPGTGEAQVMVQVSLDVPRGGKASNYTGLMQVLDVNTAESSTYLRFTFTKASITKVDP